MHDAVLARGLLGGPFARTHDDLRLAFLLEHLLAVPLAAGELDLRVDQFALLLLEVGLGDAHHAFRRLPARRMSTSSYAEKLPPYQVISPEHRSAI